MKLIQRHAKKWCRVLKKVYFKKGKNIIFEDKSIFFKRYGVHNTIALHSSEFKLIKRNTKRLTHFNIQWTGHKQGKKYLIAKIERLGYFNGIVYKPPILSCNNFILTKCLSVQNHNKYGNLRDNVFKYSLSNIRDINSLKKTIKRRYKMSLAHISDSKKMSLGVAITELKIIKRF
jgi:hypothetical protein|tara:strand:- start:946 stop:1470 length:525 start_codon:yes stop_codon:yes gene_type:complete